MNEGTRIPKFTNLSKLSHMLEVLEWKEEIALSPENPGSRNDSYRLTTTSTFPDGPLVPELDGELDVPQV